MKFREGAIRFWRESAGLAEVPQLVLVVAILAIGLTVGLVSFRDMIVQNLGDVALALENLDQSFSITVNGETREFVDSPPVLDPEGEPPAGISLSEPATPEQN